MKNAMMEITNNLMVVFNANGSVNMNASTVIGEFVRNVRMATI